MQGGVRGLTAVAGGPESTARSGPGSRPLVSVVVPVYNGGEEIVENVRLIRRAVSDGLFGEGVELIVVSDGSIDDTAERLLGARDERSFRVIHYDRNLGKGYAVKAGALASHGEWVALIDADLDLDPGAIPRYLQLAREERLDLAIGSKRHPDSVVHYPRSRKVASWCYQQLNRFLFRLNVRDTQVGLKLFSRRVVEDVMPLLLVKRFAFDLELLAVARALGYDRIRELPVRLDYRFSGSGVRSVAVLGALWDTAAIFYRLRILKTYERKRRLFHGQAAFLQDELPLVTVVGAARAAERLDYARLEVLEGPVDEQAAAANGELLALLAPDARPAGNWVTASVPFFADEKVAAVVAPTLSPLGSALRERVAAAVLESRLGGGSRRMSYFPGNVRIVVDHPAESLVVRRDDYVAALASGVEREEVVAWLATGGRATVYTPDTSLSVAPAPIIRPHLVSTFRHGCARGRVARRTRGRSLTVATARSVAPATGALLGTALLLGRGPVHSAAVALILVYGAALLVSGIHATVRFRSAAVGVLQPPAVIVTQVAYLCGFIRGLALRTA
jgi:glycosyltransferase involved in cell wall biosynthesis